MIKQEQFTMLPSGSPIDELIFDRDNAYATDSEAWKSGLVPLIAESCALHYEHCEVWRRLAERVDFKPDHVREYADLASIPLLPVSLFKRLRITSRVDGAVGDGFLSSGTTGTRSVIVRDDRTLDRLAGGIRQAFNFMDDILDEVDYDLGVRIINLGPPRSLADGVWFPYIMSLVEKGMPTTHYGELTDSELDSITGDIVGLDPDMEIGIIGPPFMVARLANHLQNRGTTWQDRKVFVITGGGWKTFDDIALSRNQFHELIRVAFGVEDCDRRVRDVFNQVELNSVLFECRSGRKHVPPWLYVAARDPDLLEPVPDGQVGLLSFIDPSATSYPCMFVGEDIGRVTPESCPCGMPGPTVEVHRRLRSSTHKGCAQQLAERARGRSRKAGLED